MYCNVLRPIQPLSGITGHVVLVGSGNSVLPALRLMFQYEGWVCSFYIYHGTMEF